MIDYYFLGKDCIIDGDLANRENLNQKLKELNFESPHVLMLNQVHGNQVKIINDAKQFYGDQNLPKADGIVTNQKNIILGIITADCAPIALWDDENQIIGLCHAGWRGAKSGVIENTISAMKILGACDIKASIGPMIQQYSYEVSQEFFDDFISENITNKKFFRTGKNETKWLFDLPNYVFERISRAGVNEIENLGIDTYTNAEKYFSFRRSKQISNDDNGRNITIIGAK
ncbi:MAG: peptidoglycan editing factor PgeF [Alphaproteobacteria bacterium]|nr:peptidoglycan editing factor PgeF [Alphaproteobacteria bacterium]